MSAPHQSSVEAGVIADMTSLRAHSMHSDVLRQHACFASCSSSSDLAKAAHSRTRMSALDRHSRFVQHLHNFKHQRARAEQDQHTAQRSAASKLQSFTTALRHAILGDADVTSIWKPAAIAATLKAKRQHVEHQSLTPEKSWASASPHVTQTQAAAHAALDQQLSLEMSLLVDSALGLQPTPECSSAAQPNSAVPPNSQTTEVSASPFLPAAADAAVSSNNQSSAQTATAAMSSNSVAKQLGRNTDSAADRSNILPAEQLGKSASCASLGGKKVQKPAWALTANAAEDVEQQEEEDLLAFASGLEFDKYIFAQEDAELQGVLQDLRAGQSTDEGKKAVLRKHVVRAINHAAGKEVQQTPSNMSEVDVASHAHQSEGAASAFSRPTATSKNRVHEKVLKEANGSLKWEASTKAGSEVGSFGKFEDVRACEELLRQNPEMKQVHSVASAAALLKKAGGLSTGATDVLGHGQYWKARA